MALLALGNSDLGIVCGMTCELREGLRRASSEGKKLGLQRETNGNVCVIILTGDVCFVLDGKAGRKVVGVKSRNDESCCCSRVLLHLQEVT